MRNISSTIVLSLAVICTLATISLGAPPAKAPIFVDCPDQIRVCTGDSIFVQVNAVHPNSNKSGGVKYFMVDGPGTVDPATGVWSYFSEDTGRVSRRPFPVEIGASIGNSPHQTYAEQNCLFEVYIAQPRRPRFIFDDQVDVAAFAAQYDTPLEIPVWVYDPYDCGVEISVQSITPGFGGFYRFKDDTALVIDIAPEDVDKRFEFTIKGESHGLIGYGTIIVDTRSVTPTPEFIECPASPVVVQPCSIVSEKVSAVLPPYNDSLGIDYDVVLGPGSIDPQGYWHYNWNENEVGQTFEVEIDASYLGRHTAPDDRCKFEVQIADAEPIDFSRFEESPCGDTLQAVIGIPGNVTVRVAENANCNPVQFFIESVTPQTARHIWCDTISYGGAAKVYFNFSPQDLGTVFAVNFRAYQMTDTVFCEFYIAVGGDDPIEPMTIRVETPIGTPLGATQDVNILLDNVPIDLGGFDLLLQYDPAILSFQSATLGDAFGENGCDWEYFTYRTEGDGLLKVVGLAETNDGDNHPNCWTPSLPTTIATMTFLTSESDAYNCGFAPIQFLWTDCGDNALSDNTGSPLYISNRVFNYGFGDLTDPNVGTYPTIRGAQNIDCFDSPEHPPVRMIDFYNGGIILSCIDSVDITGDVNLNGIAYEIADYVMFSAYLIFGQSAFTVSPDDQLAATDVNTDGTPGQIEDLTYLGAIILGDLVPQQGPFPPSKDTLLLHRPTPSDLVVEFAGADQIGAFLLVVADSVYPSLAQTDLEMGLNYDGQITTILINSWPDKVFSNGLLLSGLDDHNIIVASAATTDGKKIPVSFDHNNPNGPTKVRIEKVELAFQGQAYDVPIFLDQADFDLGGFDFLIGYPSEMLSFQHAEFGDAFNENGCGWEYFTYRIDSPGLLKLVGLAETNNGPIHPTCWTPDSLPTPFATLNFLVSSDPIYECLFAPVTFFWTDCGDNSLADKSGNDLYISSALFDVFGNDIADPTIGTYPTNLGAQDFDCFNNPTHLPIRNIEFTNGGIDVVCVQPIEVIGDVNLNGIVYEIADYVLFANYLIYGEQVFKVDLEGQRAATDINTDSVLAQVEDLTYLGAIVRGDMLPYKGPFPASDDTLILDSPNPTDLNVVFSSNTDEIGAILVVVSDSVSPVLLQSSMDIGFNYDGANTTILIYSWDGETIGSGQLLSGLAGHEPLGATAATADGRKIVTYVTGNEGLAPAANLQLPENYSLAQNFPNPFNPSTTIRFDLPQASTVHFAVINILGKTVYDFSRNFEAGIQEVIWNGTDNSGNEVASGVYYYRIESGDFSQTRKMVLLK